jgi:NAD(P)H-hydrate repair Nnr-like enzyme with NAD(P)H-hydrate dehydratase domain
MSASVPGSITRALRFQPPAGDPVRVNVNRAWARRVAAAHLGPETSPVKGDRGFVIVVGGSALYGSSPYMAGLGALRAGAHCVYTVAPAGPAAAAVGLQMHRVPVSGPELDARVVDDLVRISSRLEEQVVRTGARGQVVWLIGPGLGGSATAMEVLDALVAARDGSTAAVVVDGSLGGGGQGVDRIRALGADTVLLNRAEAAALTGAGERLTEREGGAAYQDLLDLSVQTGAVVAAKGPTDLVVTPQSAHRISAGHPDLAKASTGDVVAGVTAGLLAQRLPARHATALACYLVGTAGHRVSRARGPGWLPTELLDALPDAWRTTRPPAPARLAHLLLHHPSTRGDKRP